MRRKKKSNRRRTPRWKSVLLVGLLVVGAGLVASGVKYYHQPLALGDYLPAGSIKSLSRTEEPGEQEVALVLEVLAGDSVIVRCAGNEETVRLRDLAGTVESGPTGKAAVSYLKKQLKGRQVRLESGPGPERDLVGRRLAYVLVDGINVNVELVRQGYFDYRAGAAGESRFGAEFRAARKEARDETLGIWKK